MIGVYMSKKIAAIYIPGLGDHRPKYQDKVYLLLKLFGIEGYYFPFGWAEGNSFEAKLNELLEMVDSLDSRGFKVNLIAASAGASGALNAFVKRKDKIKSVALICGKVNNLDEIGGTYFDINPKFKQSVGILPESLKELDSTSRARIMSIRPLRDSVVPPKDTIIEGARNLQSFTFGHSSTIAHYLTVGLPRIAWWIRKNS